MEEPSKISLHICQSILQQTLLPQVTQQLPHPNRLQLFSCQQSQGFANTLLFTSNYAHDQPANRLSEDQPGQSLSIKCFKVRHTRKPQPCKSSLKENIRKQTMSTQVFFLPPEDISGLNLVPLKTTDIESEGEPQQDDLEARMRQVKVHQQYVRTKYAENQRQTNKKTYTIHKTDSKATPKMHIYDYDGSLIPPIKLQGTRMPIHFIDLDVKLQEQIQEASPKVVKKIKPKHEVKFQNSIRKQQLRPVYSAFLRELSNVEWVEGAQLQSSKDQCRKILGYNQPQQLLRKRKVDLLKSSQVPIRMKFQDLQSYKTIAKSNAKLSFCRKSDKANQGSNTILSRHQINTISHMEKTIQIANNKALQYLIRDDIQSAESKTKKSLFSMSSKKAPAKSMYSTSSH